MNGRCAQGQPLSLLGDGAERFPARSARYTVTELHGFYLPARGTNERPGMSVHVIDTLACHRIVATWRTEDYAGSSFGSRTGKDAALRGFARDACDRLNAEHEASLT